MNVKCFETAKVDKYFRPANVSAVFFLISPLKMKKFASFGFEKEQLTHPGV